MASSGTYNFSSIQVDDLVTDAYERCGITPDLSTGQQSVSALRALNLMFINWVTNAGTNAPLLWLVEQCQLDLVEGQNTYSLPHGTFDVAGNELTAATQTRELGGTPFSSAPTASPTPGAGGTAANAFDGNVNTDCTQTASNGCIGYDFGASNPQTIRYVGIISAVDATYDIAIEYSFSNADPLEGWYTAYSTGSQDYVAGQTKWYIPVVPVQAQYWRIREVSVNGAFLNIAELYFNVPNTSYRLSRISRMDYISISNKGQQSTQSSFIVLKNITPSLVLWPVPDGTYDYLVYNRIRYVQDVTALTQTVDVPPAALEAVTSGLAAAISLKWAPEKFPLLKMQADQAMNVFLATNVEDVPVRFQISNYPT